MLKNLSGIKKSSKISSHKKGGSPREKELLQGVLLEGYLRPELHENLRRFPPMGR